jgi:hypothetical protein
MKNRKAKILIVDDEEGFTKLTDSPSRIMKSARKTLLRVPSRQRAGFSPT